MNRASTIAFDNDPNRQRGFILPLTLWVIAAIGLAVVAVNEWITQATDNAQVLRQQVDAALAVSDIQNEIVFAMGTRPMTFRGMEVGRLLEKVDRADAMAVMTAEFRTDRYIRMDGRPYKVESHPDYDIQIYDGRGLINVNAGGAVYLRRSLGLFNIPEQQRNSLIDTLDDYTDRDDLTRLSGAEAREYRNVGRRAPANAWLTSPMELQYVLGWDQLTDLWLRDRESPLLTTCITPGFNPNSASREALLSYFPGMLEEDVQNVLKRREEKPFRNIREFASSAGTLVRDEPFAYVFAPGTCIVVDVTHRPTNDRTRFSLTIDVLNAKTKPWQIDYVLQIPRKPPSVRREPFPTEVFPAPDTVDANERANPEDTNPGAPSPVDRQPSNDPPSNL